MGRKKKYFTKEEKKKAQRRWQMEHYMRNREKKTQEFYDKKVQQMYRDIE